MSDFILKQAYMALREIEKLIGFIEGETAHFEHERSQFKILAFQSANAETLQNTQKEVQKQTNQRIMKSKKTYLQNKEIKEVNMFTLKDCSTRKKGNGYECRFRKLGIIKSKGGKTKKEAETKMQKFLTALNKDVKNVGNTLPSLKKPEVNRFIDIADYFFYSIKKELIKPQTFISYKSKYENYIKKPYKNCTFSELTPIKLQEDLRKLRNTVSRTYEDVRMLLNGIFNYAKANGIITLNPIDAVYLPPHERINGTALTPNEEKIFISSIVNTPHEGAFLLMLYAGARPSEIENIQIDTKNETITIKNAKLKRHQKITHRILPLFPMLKRKLECVLGCKTDYTKNYLNETLRKILPNHTAKDLRHTFASRAKECGVNSELVNVWQGHVPASDMTSLVYTHFSMEYQKKQAELFVYGL